jgi:hypothetical protein
MSVQWKVILFMKTVFYYHFSYSSCNQTHISLVQGQAPAVFTSFPDGYWFQQSLHSNNIETHVIKYPPPVWCFHVKMFSCYHYDIRTITMSMLHVTAGRGGQTAIILTFCWLQGQLCHIQWHFGELLRHLCHLQTTGRLNKPQGQLSHQKEQFCKLQGQLCWL